MPPGWRARLRQRQGQRAALNRPWLKDGVPDLPSVPCDPFVDHPPLSRVIHPTWFHVERIEPTGPPVVIAECLTESAAIYVMNRERWRTRLTKWKREHYESVHPLKPGA